MVSTWIGTVAGPVDPQGVTEVMPLGMRSREKRRLFCHTFTGDTYFDLLAKHSFESYVTVLPMSPSSVATDTCFRKIYNVKSKDVVHECVTTFGAFPVTGALLT